MMDPLPSLNPNHGHIIFNFIRVDEPIEGLFKYCNPESTAEFTDTDDGGTSVLNLFTSPSLQIFNNPHQLTSKLRLTHNKLKKKLKQQSPLCVYMEMAFTKRR